MGCPITSDPPWSDGAALSLQATYTGAHAKHGPPYVVRRVTYRDGVRVDQGPIERRIPDLIAALGWVEEQLGIVRLIVATREYPAIVELWIE